MRKIRFYKLLRIFMSLILLAGAMFLIVDQYIEHSGKARLVSVEKAPGADAIIVLGAYVLPGGEVSDMLRDRLDTGFELYRQKKAPKIVVSGDHGRTSYDEVNSMRKYLQSKGVPREDIFMDHAGFSTYDSLYRARDIFRIKKALVVTQEYHLVRALYIAGELGLEASGVKSDLHGYPGMGYYRFREVGARFKAFMQTDVLHSKPEFLGEALPISGNGIITDDGKS